MNKGRIPGRTKSRPIIARRCANVMWASTRLFEYGRLSTLPSCSYIIASSQPTHLVWPLTAHWEEGQSPKSSLFLAGVGGCLAAPPCVHQGLNFALGLIKRRLGALAVEDRSLDSPLDDVRYLCEMCERREENPAAASRPVKLPVPEISCRRTTQAFAI